MDKLDRLRLYWRLVEVDMNDDRNRLNNYSPKQLALLPASDATKIKNDIKFKRNSFVGVTQSKLFGTF